jgi:hypothetical protein
MPIFDTLVNFAIENARNQASLSQANAQDAYNAATGGHVYTFTPPAKEEAREPNVFIPNRASGIDQALWDSTYSRIVDDLSDKFARFFIDYFPLNDGLMAQVEGWLSSAIAGGTGINTVVGARIWQRDRDRITTESAAGLEDVTSQLAARGFPMPPGALYGATQDNLAARAIGVAAVSRDAAIKEWETEIENVRFAVKAVIDYRTAAIAAASDYLRAMALGPQLATQMATAASDAQARLISAATGMYNARISAAELAQRRGLSIMDAELRQTIAAGDNKVEYVKQKVGASVAAMNSTGQVAAASMNGLSATAQKIVSAG